MYEYDDGWVRYGEDWIFRWVRWEGYAPHYTTRSTATKWYEAPAIDGLEYV